MRTYQKQIEGISKVLEDSFLVLVSVLNEIFTQEIPNGATKIVLWVPLGTDYNLHFSYMNNEGSELEIRDGLSVLDPVLYRLLDHAYDELPGQEHEFGRDIDIIFAKWLNKGLDTSKFKNTKLHKVMAINNVCAYIDLSTLKVLKDSEMWSQP